MALTKVIGSGIGTVTDNVVITSDDPTITMTDSSGTNDIGTIQATSGALIFTARDGSADGEIIFKKTDGSATDESMRITSSGQLASGTSDAGTAQVRIEGATGGSATMGVKNTSSSGNVIVMIAQVLANGANSSSAFFQGNTPSNNYYLLGNGTHTFTSDERRKKNIETTRDGYLEDLAKLRVVKYNWKEQENGEDKELGLIAQEVEKVFPKLVQDDLNPISEDDDTIYKTLKQSVLPIMLLKALQEANSKITALEARITALESA